MAHIALHFVLPLLVAIGVYPQRWLAATVLMCATILVDLDHLLASPIYDPGRCSIGFHPLHQPLVMCVYAGLLFSRKLRLVGLGLLIHMALDAIDCRGNTGLWMHAGAGSY